MKDSNKNKKITKLLKLVSIIVISISVIFISNIFNKNVVFADSGFDFDYDSGSDWGGSSDWESSSYWDDDDYYYRGGRSYSNVSSGSIGTFIFFFTIIIIITIVVLSSKKESGPTIRQSVPIARVNDEPIVDKVKIHIPDFNKFEFLQEGYQIYIDVQNAWMNFKLEDVKDKITDEMFNMYQSQLDTLEVKGEQNIMRDFKLVNSYLKDVVRQNENITITASYTVDFFDYIVEKSTGKVLRGSAAVKMRVTYDMKFRRTLDEKQAIDHCPNCGAKFENINGSGVCEYCGSKIVSENKKWILTDKKTTNQTRA